MLVRALRFKQVIARKGYISPHEFLHPLPEPDVQRIALAVQRLIEGVGSGAGA